MTFFRVVALALPLAAAVLTPALWAWRPGWKAATVGHGALLGLLLLGGLATGAPVGVLLAAAAMTTAFALFALGLHLAAGQVVSGLVAVLLSSTLFLGPAVVEEAVGRRRRDQAQSRFDAMLAVNPWAVLAAGSLDIDLLRDFGSMYRSSSAADYVDARPPSWPAVAGGYALAGVLLGAASRRLRRKPS